MGPRAYHTTRLILPIAVQGTVVQRLCRQTNLTGFQPDDLVRLQGPAGPIAGKVDQTIWRISEGQADVVLHWKLIFVKPVPTAELIAYLLENGWEIYHE